MVKPMKQKKKKSGHSKQALPVQEVHDLVQVDAFMIPAPFADMYRVLREAVAEDLEQGLLSHYPLVKRVQDNEVEGEAVVAYDAQEVEQVRIYLNPTNVSQAQKSRDKQQMDKFIEQFLVKSK